jgi:hypothetical protein
MRGLWEAPLFTHFLVRRYILPDAGLKVQDLRLELKQKDLSFKGLNEPAKEQQCRKKQH